MNLRDILTVLESVGKHPKGEGLDAGDRLFFRCAVRERARQLGNFADPSAVSLTF